MPANHQGCGARSAKGIEAALRREKAGSREALRAIPNLASATGPRL